MTFHQGWRRCALRRCFGTDGWRCGNFRMGCGCQEEDGKSGEAAHGYSTLYEVLLTGWLAAFAGRKTVSKNEPSTLSPAGPSPAPWKKS